MNAGHSTSKLSGVIWRASVIRQLSHGVQRWDANREQGAYNQPPGQDQTRNIRHCRQLRALASLKDRNRCARKRLDPQVQSAAKWLDEVACVVDITDACDLGRCHVPPGVGVHSTEALRLTDRLEELMALVGSVRLNRLESKGHEEVDSHVWTCIPDASTSSRSGDRRVTEFCLNLTCDGCKLMGRAVLIGPI